MDWPEQPLTRHLKPQDRARRYTFDPLASSPFSHLLWPYTKQKAMSQRARSHIHCPRTFEQMVTNLGLQAKLQELTACNLTTIGPMASACSWNPEHTTDALVKTNVVMRVCQWDGTGNEPPQASSLKNRLWDCIQENMQDTRGTTLV